LTEESKKAAAREFARLLEKASCRPVAWGRNAWGLLQWDKETQLYVRQLGGPTAEQRLRLWFREAVTVDPRAEGK
jgi:hypothetical protein